VDLDSPVGDSSGGRFAWQRWERGEGGSLNSIVFFDLETQYLADEVAGWDNIHKMGLAVAVTYSTADAIYRHFVEEQAAELVSELEQADLVVGYNLFRFDYTVLQPYTDVELRRLRSVDMLRDIYRALGFRLSLDAVASATVNATKSADGIQAVQWYRRGELDKVIAYCQRDVEVTREVYEFGRRQGFVRYRDRNYRVRQVPVRW
jgi:DEAD/DEAH box helicase domain-containing protein